MSAMKHARDFHDGRRDGLVPLQSLDPQAITSFAGLLRAMGKTAFGGRALGEAFDVTLEMVRDRRCKVVLTLSGAMTIAKMGGVIARMIEAEMVQAIVSTGALIAHGMSEAVGMVHYRHDPRMSDEELFEKGYNRVYDTLEMEANLNYVEAFTSKALDSLAGEELSSERLCKALGAELAKKPQGHGVLRAAYLKGVPVYIPAFTDSELGLDLGTWAMHRAHRKGQDPLELFSTLPRFNPYRDLMSFARFALSAERLGIFTIGGGVPRNWAQEVGPFVDIVNHRLDVGLTPPRYRYAVRICPEPVHWGGLSGCTYSEGVSWGKFVPPAEGGRFAEVYADATTVWPLLVKGVLEELGVGPAAAQGKPGGARRPAAKQAAKRGASRKPGARRPGRGR
jgi:deoxyhypusine synthase